MIRGGLWQVSRVCARDFAIVAANSFFPDKKQKRPSLCVVRWNQRCLPIPALRAYSSPGWGSAPAFAKPAFAKPAFAPAVTSSGSTLLPHEIEARERAARLLEQEEQKRARDTRPQPAASKLPTPDGKGVVSLSFDGPGAEFSREPPRHSDYEAKPTARRTSGHYINPPQFRPAEALLRVSRSKAAGLSTVPSRIRPANSSQRSSRLDLGGGEFLRVPPKHHDAEAKSTTPRRAVLKEFADLPIVPPQIRLGGPPLRPSKSNPTASNGAPPARDGIGGAAGTQTDHRSSQQPSSQATISSSANAASTSTASQAVNTNLPPRPGSTAPPTSKQTGWGSRPAFSQPAFPPSPSLDALLPQEREARDRAARQAQQQKPTEPALESVDGFPIEVPFRGFGPRAPARQPPQVKPELPLRGFFHKELRETFTLPKRNPSTRPLEVAADQVWGQLRRKPDSSRPAEKTFSADPTDFWEAAKNKYPSGFPEIGVPSSRRPAVGSRGPPPVASGNSAPDPQDDPWAKLEAAILKPTTTPGLLGIGECSSKRPAAGSRGLPPVTSGSPATDNQEDPWAKLEASIYSPKATSSAKATKSFFDAEAANPHPQASHPETSESGWISGARDSVDAEEGEPEPQSGWAVRHAVVSRDPTLSWLEESGERDESSAGRLRRRTPAEVENDRQARAEREARARKRNRNDRFGGREEEFDDDDGGESYQERRRRRLERKAEKERAKQEALLEAGPIPILLPEFISVANLGVALGVKQDIFVSQLGELGFENITKESILTGETAALVAQEYGFDPTVEIGEEEDLRPRPPPEDPSSLPLRPPVVTIMGHVDHGKTTLLDYLRKSSIVSQEHGGITQHIGAFSVNLSSGKPITFLDTPGHAAFLTMRQRGANVTDMIILVVAADDSVKPQTLEALKHARGAKVPIIVAINKVDKDSANVDRVKSDLAANGVEIEDFGGDVQVVCVSGKTGQGMGDLEDSILTLSEMLDIRAETDGMAEGWVLESSIKPIGRVATVLVKRGTLRTGDHIVAGRVSAKIRVLRNEAGVEVDEAPPGTAVEILGWKEPPDAGDQVLQAPNEDRAKTAARYRQELKDREENIAQQAQQDLERREKALAEELANADEEAGEDEPADTGPKIINFTVKGDVHGSVEAVRASVLEIGNNEVRPRVLQSAAGQITESDVEHAAISGSTILNFNNPIPGHIKHMAEEAGVKILDHNVIYHLAEAVRDKLSDYLTPILNTRVTGEAEILQVFPINVKGRVYRNVAGCRVRNGAVVRNTKVRVTRDGEQIFEGTMPLNFPLSDDTPLTRRQGASRR
jgi:translation initiation factor IF-2